ncbi:hypothetical protein HD554DRAFT_2022600 [Boletus coccyginus]|nr:hypothetical protein HD554DRAFT_2022600 [Boletus coccyginus]
MPPLPVELLARIFIESLPREAYLKPDVDDVPLVLTRVCRRWRDVALRTTRLWCSLSAIEQYWSTLLPMHKARVDGYATWLSRSGNRPLSLAVPFPGPVIGRWGQEWVKLLRRYRARFEQLRVVDGYGVDLDDLLDSTQMLKLLEVSHDDAPDRHLAIARPPPSLRTLVLDSVNASPAALPGATWGWANITHLEVHFRGDVHALRTAIQFCPNIRVLTISGHRCSRQSTSLATCVTYPSLRDLFIAVDAPLGNVLQMATLPGLQHLTIHAPGFGERKNVRAMLLRSRCALESLEVWETWSQGDSWARWTDEEREELSTLLPTLTALKLVP